MIATIAMMVITTGMMAAPPTPAEGSKVVLTWKEFVKITGFDPTGKSGGGQVIKVPWSDIEKLLDVKVDRVGTDATVDLPWKEFKALLEYSVKTKKVDKKPAPPADFIVSDSLYTGTLSPDGAVFTLDLKVNILKDKGWKRIPVLPATVALKSSTLPEGVHLNVYGSYYELLTAKTGEIAVQLTFATAVTKSAGTNIVSFARPAAGSSIIKLSVDGKDVSVVVASAQSLKIGSENDKTGVIAALPTRVGAHISWKRAIPKAPAAPTKMYALTNTLVSVADGLLICQETIDYNILHSPINKLALKVPEKASVLTVVGANIQSWRVEKGMLNITLARETIGSYKLNITYEQASSTKANTPVPVISSQGVEREKGFVAVVALANVEIGSGDITGATEIDARRLPGTLAARTNNPILMGFRYVGDKVAIPLTIKRHGAVSVLVTVADSLVATGMQLNDGRRMTKALYSIRNNRNQFLRLNMPTGSEIWSVSVAGKTVTPGKDKDGKILIPLVRSKSSASELTAFPVTIVYVETPARKVPAAGQMKVTLPVCDAPVMHIMYNAYLPAGGKYTAGWGKSTFAGPLQLVKRFASLSTSTEAIVAANAPVRQARMMQKQFNGRADLRKRAAGETPIRVKLPLNGIQLRLEKILALPGDSLWFEYNYANWQAAK